MRNKVLFWIFFIILLWINTYMFRFLYQLTLDLIPISIGTDIMTILLYLIIVIPLAAFLSEKVVAYALTKGLDKSKNFKIFVSVIIIVPIALFSLMIYNDYREKDLDDVISFNPTKFQSLVIKVPVISN